VNSNKYKDRIRIEAPGALRDPVYGTPIPASWSTFAEVWAEVQDVLPSKKSEVSADGIRLATAATRIRFRPVPGLAATMRVVELCGLQRIFSIVGEPASLQGGREVEIVGEKFSS
jgi:head-tail adaptor